MKSRNFLLAGVATLLMILAVSFLPLMRCYLNEVLIDGKIKVWEIKILGRVGNEKAISPLIRLIPNDSLGQRFPYTFTEKSKIQKEYDRGYAAENALFDLWKRGYPVFPQLIDAIWGKTDPRFKCHSPSGDVRWESVPIIDQEFHSRVMDLFRRMCDDEDHELSPKEKEMILWIAINDIWAARTEISLYYPLELLYCFPDERAIPCLEFVAKNALCDNCTRSSAENILKRIRGKNS